MHDPLRLAVDLGKGVAHRGVVADRDRDRVTDQMGEGDLHVALRRLQCLVQLPAAAVERVDLERAEARGGRDLEALLHVAREGRVGTPDRSQLRFRDGGPRRCRGRSVAAVALDVREDVLLHHLAARPAAAHLLEVDAVRGRDPPRDGSAGRVGGRRQRRGGGRSSSGGRLTAVSTLGSHGRRLPLRRGSVACGRLAGLQLRQGLPDLDGLILLREDLHQLARLGGGDLGIDLVGRHLDDRLVLVDPVPFLLVPGEDRALGHRLTHLGHGDLDGFGHQRFILARPRRRRQAGPLHAHGPPRPACDRRRRRRA